MKKISTLLVAGFLYQEMQKEVAAYPINLPLHNHSPSYDGLWFRL
ncbi:hypothetical protein CULT_2120005 [[Clostridium] ultunense Esp]|nr:hypothetical protein CULT_2120005 [[Clostridium] ultunense Esp]